MESRIGEQDIQRDPPINRPGGICRGKKTTKV